jgi:hypothetical protein
MYCPRCGRELVDTGRELTCLRGNMGLSQRMAARLTECFVLKTREPREVRASFEWGGTWHCPACGVRAQEEEPGVVRCPGCRRNLGEFLYELIEFHPHSKEEV